MAIDRTTHLEKAEWIKFSAHCMVSHKSKSIFSEIEKNTIPLALAKRPLKPTTLSGAMFQDQWYVPQGESWAALFIKDAHALYLWQTPKELAGFLSL
jgi:iron complex transport system substrate-binding protein